MASNYFMRGVIDTTKTINCYLIGRSGGTYYIFYNPPAADTTDQAAFASLPYSTATGSYVPRLVIPQVASSPQVYTATNGSTGVSPATWYLRAALNITATQPATIINPLYRTVWQGVNNVLEISPNSTGSDLQLVCSEAVDSRRLYAGIWYTVLTADGSPCSFKRQALGTIPGPWKGVASPTSVVPTESDFQIMLIPRDAGSSGSVAVWAVSNGISDCYYPDNILLLFNSYVSGDSDTISNCDTGTWIADGNSYGCAFVSLASCQQEYLYEYCSAGYQCGSCYGVCAANADGSIPFCQFDYDPDIKTSGLSPLSCNPKYSSPVTIAQEYGIYIIIGLIIIFVITAVLIYVAWKFVHPSNPPAPAPAPVYSASNPYQYANYRITP